MISWYVIHTPNQAATKHIFDTYDDVRETFYPMQHNGVGVNGLKKAGSLFPSYVFVRGELKTVRKIVKLNSSFNLSYVQKNDERLPMVIPDGEMEVFKSFNEYHLDMMWLRDPYQDFVRNDRARILSGPFAGYEGFIKEIKHDLKLVFRVGIWAIAISNVHKYDVAIVSHGDDVPEVGRMARLVDYFTMAIRDAGLGGNAYETLREIIGGIGRCRSMERYERLLDREASANKSGTGSKAKPVDTMTIRAFLREMKGDEREMLEQMARYIYSKDPVPVLSRLIPDAILRPFLTPTQGSDGIAVEMTEGIYDANTDKVAETVNEYFAHVIIVNNTDGSRTLITNWTYFYRQYDDMTQEAKEQLKTRLEKFGLSRFRGCLSTEEPVHFMELPEQGIAGLGMTIRKGENIERAQSRLIDEGIALCKEISASTRLRPWQRHLSTVWVK